ncbi:hypothetical protein FB451DRAFT_1228102 [Mycena latifolia]|nr:hypothetical protein FB451DRAFT_1228102 [Mycena latifolia]
MSPRLSLFAAALGFVAAVAALSNVQAPSSTTPDSNVTVTWSSDSSDTTPATLALFSADTNQTYSGGLAVLSNVNLQANQAAVLFPQVVPGSYILKFLSASDPSNVLASSPTFSVGAAAAPSSTPAATGSAPSGSATVTAPASATSSLSAAASSRSAAASSLSAAASSISGSLSSAASSISNAASSAASSARSVASSALSSAASAASASPSPSTTTGGAGSLHSVSLALVLGGLALGFFA